MCAPVRNPRVRWRSDALELPTPQTALPVFSPQTVPFSHTTLAYTYVSHP